MKEFKIFENKKRIKPDYIAFHDLCTVVP